jgi:hypothetical protein
MTYLVLYNMCLDQDCSVFEVAQKGWVIDFRVRLHVVIRYPSGNGLLRKCSLLNLFMINYLGGW